MKKRFFKVISIMLVLALAVPATVGAAGAGVLTSCGGNCDYSPTIVVHGIGQSQTYLADENGNQVYDADGKPITGWPLYTDTDYAIKKLVLPLLSSLLFQRDMGLCDAAEDVVAELFKWNSFDHNGKNNYNIVTKRYPQSVALCTAEEKEEIYDNVPLQDYAQIAGEDHLYYFAYNSFGNNAEICAELYEFIEQVKKETGHDKVNLTPISLGGTIANGLVDYYPDVMQSLDRVIYIVPALNGSKIVGDLFKGKLSTSDKMLYDYLFPTLCDDEVTGNLINILIRIFPSKVIRSFLDSVVHSLVGDVLVNCTNIWALVPSEDFDEAYAKWFPSELQTEVQAQILRYHEAQVNSLKNIQKMKDMGVEVFDVVDYSYPLYCLVPSFSSCNADGIIQIESTGMGLESCLVGEQYPESYVQKNKNKLGTSNCSDTTHNHISPDREVDASTCLLPDQTFFFYGQDHEGTGRNDVIMKLSTALLTDKTMTDVYSNPNFPQFNIGRETKKLIKGMLKDAKAIDQTTLTDSEREMLNSAIEACDKMLASTVVVAGEYEAAEAKLTDALVALGLREVPKDDSSNETLGKILKGINTALNKTLGYRGFTG